MSAITRQQLDSAYAEWVSTMDLDFEDRDHRKRDAHVAFLRAQDAYTGTRLGEATIKALYPDVAAPVLSEGRYRGVIHAAWAHPYIYCPSLLKELRVLSVMGLRLSQVPDGAEVEFSANMSFSGALRVVLVGNEASEAAYAKRLALPSNPVQRRPRNLEEARHQAADRKAKGIVPRVAVPALLSGDASVRDAAMSDYMDRYYEGPIEADSQQQQAQDRALLKEYARKGDL